MRINDAEVAIAPLLSSPISVTAKDKIMNTNQDLINELIGSDYLKTPRIIQAFENVDRIDFVLPESRHEAYENFPLSIGHGQTISQPATVAFMLELLKPEPGDKILDVGSGSGWQTALLSYIVGDRGRVIGLEVKDDLIEFGQTNLKKYNFTQTKIVQRNGWQGLPEEAPFDKISVVASAPIVPPNLKIQLKEGGRLIIPVGRGVQDIAVINKVDEDNFTEQYYPSFVFVPLVEKK